ncbi:MAG: beta-N-acetylhexosaminidase [Phycisphaerae bacterium]|jgi:hexosaminidase|nr:beta-N-acetylhexosaminidase [Phycisphaerae bacterium]
MKPCIFTLLLISSFVLAAEPSIIPRPLSLKTVDNGYEITAGTTISSDKAFKSEADFLVDTLGACTGFEFKTASDAGIRLRKIDEVLLGAEGYLLSINDKRVEIRANAAAGAFYGVQTLLSMLPAEVVSPKVATGVKWSLPGVEIMDSPSFTWRAFMLDEARNFKGEKEVKKLLDTMARCKMNVFQWHLTDDQGWRIEIKKYPKLTEIGSRRKDTQIGGWKSPLRSGRPHSGFYTQEQIKRIVAYAAKRHITIVPEIGMPGHASAAVAAYPELGVGGKKIEVPVTFGKHANLYNVADENVYKMISEILDEVVALFPGKVIHIGGDEVQTGKWRESDEVAKLMKSRGLKTYSDVQVYFTNRISQIVEAKGRHIMGWNEITGDQVHGGSGAKGSAKLSPDAVVQFWKGSTDQMTAAIRAGHNTVNSTHSSTYLDYPYGKIPLSRAYAFDPIPRGLEDKYKPKVVGLGCQMWGEWIQSVERMEFQVYPRIFAYAEAAWTARGRKDYKSFSERLGPTLKRLDILKIGYARGVVEMPRYPADYFKDFVKIGAWTDSQLRKEYLLEYDATSVVKGPGTYEAAGNFTGGKHPLSTLWMALCEDGREIARDTRPGFAGKTNINNVYRLAVRNYKPSARYSVRIEVDKVKGAKSAGDIRMRRVNDK